MVALKGHAFAHKQHIDFIQCSFRRNCRAHETYFLLMSVVSDAPDEIIRPRAAL